jgi:hypothetical protein
MKSEIKAAFQKAAEEHEARAVERLREQEKRLTDRDQFEARWRDTRARIVLPALRQIGEEVLTPAGWTSEVRSDDKEESATIEVYRGSMHALGTTRRPSITFVIDRHSPTIFVTSQSISQGGGQGKFPCSRHRAQIFSALDLRRIEFRSVPPAASRAPLGLNIGTLILRHFFASAALRRSNDQDSSAALHGLRS